LVPVAHMWTAVTKSFNVPQVGIGVMQSLWLRRWSEEYG